MKHINILLSIVLTSLLAACGQETAAPNAAPNAAPKPSLDDELKEEAKQAVLAILKDPSSAQFRNIRQISPGMICGEVNGKTSMGGYAGFQRFSWMVVDPKNANLISDTSTECR